MENETIPFEKEGEGRKEGKQRSLSFSLKGGKGQALLSRLVGQWSDWDRLVPASAEMHSVYTDQDLGQPIGFSCLLLSVLAHEKCFVWLEVRNGLKGCRKRQERQQQCWEVKDPPTWPVQMEKCFCQLQPPSTAFLS